MPQDSQRSPLTATPTYSQATPSGRVGSGIGDEAHLVDDMCTPGGLRAQPDREDLRLFVENAASLNGTTVAELLQAKMVRAPQRGLQCTSVEIFLKQADVCRVLHTMDTMCLA